MDITCPSCGHGGTIADELIPEAGRGVNCPKCKKKFFVTPDIPVMEVDEGDLGALSTGEEEAAAPEAPPAGKEPRRRQDTVRTLFVASGLIFGMVLCFIAGRLSLGQNPLAPRPLTPTKESPAAPTAEKPAEVTGLPSDLPLLVLPEERFVGAETVDIVKIDEKIADLSALSDPDKRKEMGRYADELAGKNVTGNFSVTRVGEVSSFFDEYLPKNEKGWFIEGAGDTKSPAHARIFLTVVAPEKVIAAIEKARKVSVRGFIYSCRASDVLELSLVNAQVRAGR